VARMYLFRRVCVLLLHSKYLWLPATAVLTSILYCCRLRLAPLLMCLPGCWQHVAMSQMLTRTATVAATLRAHMTNGLRLCSSIIELCSGCNKVRVFLGRLSSGMDIPGFENQGKKLKSIPGFIHFALQI